TRKTSWTRPSTCGWSRVSAVRPRSCDPGGCASSSVARAWKPIRTSTPRRAEPTTEGWMNGDEPARVLALLRQHGFNTTSFQVLEEGIAYWFDPAGDACVAYVDTGRAWVAAGAPIAPEARLEAVCQAFIQAARAVGKRVCFFALQDRLAERSVLSSMPVGVQPSWLPREWPRTLERSRSLREQLRRARAKGVSVRAVPASEIAAPSSVVRAAMEAVIASWLASRKMAPMGF